MRGSSFSVRQSPSTFSDAKHVRRHSVAESSPRGLRRQSSLVQYRERERERERAASQAVEPSPRAVLARTFSQGQRRKSLPGMASFSEADRLSQAEVRGGGAGGGEQEAVQSVEVTAAAVAGVSGEGEREREGGVEHKEEADVNATAEGKESVEKKSSQKEIEPQGDVRERKTEESEGGMGGSGKTAEPQAKAESEHHSMAHSLSDVKEEEEEEVEWGRQEVKRRPSLKTIRERDDMGSGTEQAGGQGREEGGEEGGAQDMASAAAAAVASVPASSSAEESAEGWREASAVRLKHGSVSLKKPPGLHIATADGSPDRNASPSVRNKRFLSFGARSSRAAASSMPSPHTSTTAAAAAVSGLATPSGRREREREREAERERSRMGAASGSSGVSNTAAGGSASGGLPPNFERIIAGMQKDLEYAQKVRGGEGEGG